MFARLLGAERTVGAQTERRGQEKERERVCDQHAYTHIMFLLMMMMMR